MRATNQNRVASIYIYRSEHICGAYVRCFWQGNHQIYGHIRCIYTVLANPRRETGAGVGAERVRVWV